MSAQAHPSYRHILAVDTSTMTQTIAVMVDGELRGERLLRTKRGHAGKLLAAIRDLIGDLGLGLPQIDLYVIGAGPGSFTGLRIGMASLKGLAFAGGKPLVALSSLAAIAMQAAGHQGLVVPLIDARKQEIYAGLYRSAEDGLMQPALTDRAFTAESFAEAIESHRQTGEHLVLLGPGLKTYRARLSERLGHQDLTILPDVYAAPRAANLALIASRTITQADIPALDTLEPNYQRLSDAEINLRRREQAQSRP